MNIIEEKKHKDRVQRFLDGKDLIIIRYGKETFETNDSETLASYIEEQDFKNDYLEKRILELEEKLNEFEYKYEKDKSFDEFGNKIKEELDG